MRKVPLTNKEYYHVYNRGVDKRNTFLDFVDFERFFLSLRLMNDKQNGLMFAWRDFHKANPTVPLKTFLTLNVRKKEPIVEIVAYCLNPNHYHLILRQLHDKGIEDFMKKVGNGYTKYFNKKNSRSGVLFQGRFKSAHIDSDEYLLYLSAYVNCNSEIHKIASAEEYLWCSFGEYLGNSNKNLVAKGKGAILRQFKNPKEYRKFALNKAKGMQKKKDDVRFLADEFSS